MTATAGDQFDVCERCGGKVEVTNGFLTHDGHNDCPADTLLVSHLTREQQLAWWNGPSKRRPPAAVAQALEVARDAFVAYADIHLAKGTEEGVLKAEANADLARQMQLAIDGCAGAPQPEPACQP